MALLVALLWIYVGQVCGEMETKKLVQVEQGMLEGSVTVTDTGVKIATFTSVPYAKPPIGPLRFKAPQRPEKWDGVRPTDIPFRTCPQFGSGDEDCLLLNIVTPLEKGDKLPVMFWIHGGAFYFGSASLDLYNVNSFVKQGVVAVSTNYRLSALGFLSLNGSDVTPNAGLKDQVAALRWVQRNIASFGGDPGNVTLFGESAGATSVQYLIVSPMARGLFSGAIMQSGSVCNHWAFREPNTEDAFALGEALGNKTDDPQQLVEFLRGLPASEIADKVLDMWNLKKNRKRLLTITTQKIPFLPTLDYTVRDGDSTEEALLPDRPTSLLRQGRFTKVPQIMGFNSLEAALLTEVPVNEEWQKVESNWKYFVPEDMGIQAGSPASKRLAAAIKEFYFHNEKLSNLSTQQLLECASDVDFGSKLTECAKYTAQFLPNQLWAYYFTYQGDDTLTCKFQNCDLVSGAAHFDEVQLMFTEIPGEGELSPRDAEVGSRLVKMWTNFAIMGQPMTGTDVVWTPVEGNTLAHLVIDTKLRMDPHDLRENYTSFWNNLAKDTAKRR